MEENYPTPLIIRPNDPRFHTYMIAVGWLCPRCQRVNNPALDQCPCVAPQLDSTIQVDITLDGSEWNGLDGPLSYQE